MNQKKNIIVKIIYFTAVLSTASSSKYDIEEESQKLHGKDLKNALLEFRMTPAYKRILNSVVKNNLLNERFAEAFNSLMLAHEPKLEAEIERVITDHVGPVDVEAPAQGDSNSTDPMLRSRGYSFFEGRHNYFPKDRISRRADKKDRATQEERDRVSRRADQEEWATPEERMENMTKTLDEFVMMERKKLPPTLRNKALDVAYEHAGNIIHDMVTMLSDDEETSSKMPDESEPATTPHARVHTLTTGKPKRRAYRYEPPFTAYVHMFD